MENSRLIPKLPRWAPLAAIILAIFLLSGIIVLIMSIINSSSSDPTENFSDITEQEEVLNDSIISAIEGNPHKDYQTQSSETKYASLTPEDFCGAIYEIDCNDILSNNLTKITAINSNILNYYLDNDYAVIIVSNTSTLVVYGAIYTTPEYLSFSLKQKYFDEYNYISRTEIFNNLTGSESFYLFPAK